MKLIKCDDGKYQFQNADGTLSEKYVRAVQYGRFRDDITLVQKEDGGPWLMRNLDGDVWGKFTDIVDCGAGEDFGYSYQGRVKFPKIMRVYDLTEGKAPLRYDENKFVDTNGYFSDECFEEDEYTGYYRPSTSSIEFRFSVYLFGLVRRDSNGNFSIRAYSKDRDRDDVTDDTRNWDDNYHDYFFEKDGKIKFLFELKTIHTGENGIELLMEDTLGKMYCPIYKSWHNPRHREDTLGLYCFRDKNGELSEPFFKAWGYNNGLARVQKYMFNRYIQYRDEKGNLSQPYKTGTDYIDGYAVVAVEGRNNNAFFGYETRYCLRDVEGNHSTECFDREDRALVKIINGTAKECFQKRILDTKVDKNQLNSYYFVGPEENGFREVQKYIAGGYQFVDKEGNLSEPFYDTHRKGAVVQKYWNSGEQVRDVENGNLSQEVHFVKWGYGNDGCAVVQLKPSGPYYLLDKDGNISAPFSEIGREDKGFRPVRKSFYHPYQIINKNWELSQKKYPDESSANLDIFDGIFKKEKVATIKPRPKELKSKENQDTTTLISTMIKNSSKNNEMAEVKETKPEQVVSEATKSDLEY